MIALGFIKRRFPHAYTIRRVCWIDHAPQDLSHIKTFVLFVYPLYPLYPLYEYPLYEYPLHKP